MVLLLISALLLQSISGLFTSDGFFYEGPFAELLTNDQLAQTFIDIHHNGFDTLIALIACHLLAIAVYLIKGNNLIRPMITGNRSVSNEEIERTNTPIPTIKSPLLALIIATIVIAGVWLATA